MSERVVVVTGGSRGLGAGIVQSFLDSGDFVATCARTPTDKTAEWTDAAGDGEFCVALRCAVLRGPNAYCYAGCGIVRDSDPAAELAESEVKLEALLPVLAG